MKICELEDSCLMVGIACDTCWRKKTIEVDCRKCVNCTGESCLIYGSNAGEAMAACARDCFAKYEPEDEAKQSIWFAQNGENTPNQKNSTTCLRKHWKKSYSI